jgi:hypothetical protein
MTGGERARRPEREASPKMHYARWTGRLPTKSPFSIPHEAEGRREISVRDSGRDTAHKNVPAATLMTVRCF